MARRPSNKSKTDTKNTEVQEDNVTATATEAPAPENTENDSKPAEQEIDLTAFLAEVEKVVNDTEQRDATTGELTPGLIEPVNNEFRKLEGAKAKNRARASLNNLMKEAMNEANMPLARSYMLLADGLTAGSTSTKSERVPADPTDAFVQRVVGLRIANELATSNVPEGVGENWKDKANELYKDSREKADAYLAWVNGDEEDRGDEPEVTTVVRSAVKLAQGKAAKVGGSVRSSTVGDGVRRDIAKHIASAFAGVDEGTFLTVAEIRKHTSEEYGDNPPSAGAISARLFPSSGKCTVEGVEPGTNDKGHKGATKVAA